MTEANIFKVQTCPSCAGIGLLEATDIFCGAGGSSLGLEHVCCPDCGRSLIKVTQALNHWALAVEAHNFNFPHADHDVHDVEVIPAKRFRRTPILWASPECVHHAYCRGKKSEGEDGVRSRATFSDIVRFTEHHRYDAVIVENVIEARLWCDIRGHKEKCNCGGSFTAWYDAMLALGYEAKVLYFNSQFAFAPQSRDRMYVVFWRKGMRTPYLDFQPTSWCSGCDSVVHGIQTWKKASKGSARSKPGLFEWGRYGSQYTYTCPRCAENVAPAVLGAKHIIDWSMDIGRIGDRAKPLADNTRKRIKTGIERLQTTRPIQVQVGGNLYERPGYARVWSVDDPLRTVTGTPYMAVVVRAGGNEGQKGKSVEEPMPTITGHDRQMGLVVPGKSDTVPTSDAEPMGTVTGHPHAGLVVQNMTHNSPKDAEEPLPPVTSGGNHMLIRVNRGGKNGKVDNGARPKDLGQPTPAVAGHGELALVEMQNHGRASSADEPARTIYGEGLHHGLLVYNGNPGFVRSLEDAAGTITGRDKQSLLVPYYGTGVAHQTDEPMGAVTGKDRQALLVTDADIDDCLFRMLQWPELLRAQVMHLKPDGSAYELTARTRDRYGKMKELSNQNRVKMIGNAVSTPVATMLGNAIVEAMR